MNKSFVRPFQVRWSDVDANGHVRHSVYADFCATLRMWWLNENGFGMNELMAVGMGPVLFKETTSYRRELLLTDEVSAGLQMVGHSQSGHKWTIEHQIFKGPEKKLAATLYAEGAWMNLRERKITPPPEKLLQLMADAEKSKDFKIIL